MQFQKIEYQSLNDQVYEQLRKKIIQNELKPGDKLDVDHLAAMMGVSRTPIISAIKMLEYNNYVVVRPRNGSFVRSLSKEETEAIFDFREALERLAIEKAVENADPRQLNRFEKSFDRMAKEFSGGEEEIGEFFEVEVKFHEYIIDLSPAIIGNALKNLVDLTKRIRRLHLLYCQQGTDKEVVGKTEILMHRDLCKAIRSGDVATAQTLIEQDIRNTKHQILENFEAIEELASR